MPVLTEFAREKWVLARDRNLTVCIVLKNNQPMRMIT